MIDVSRNLFEEYSGTYLYHLKSGEEIRIDLEQGKTLLITGQRVDLKEISSDTCDVVTSMERFRADGKRYYQDLANGDIIGVILNDDQGLLLSPQILEDMDKIQKEQPDLSLTEEDLSFGNQMTLDEFGLG